MKKIVLSLLVGLSCSSFAMEAEGPDWQKTKYKVEYAVSICESYADLVRKLELSEFKKKRRTIYYFDTQDRSLYNKGLIVRLRYTDGYKKASLTLKARPYIEDPAKNPPQDREGYKCEWDVNRSKTVLSCSDKQDVTVSEAQHISQVNPFPVARVRDTQWEIADYVANGDGTSLPWDDVSRVGPIHTVRWKKVRAFKKTSDFPVEDAEIQVWNLKNGPQIVEASFRVEAKSFIQSRIEFDRILEEADIHLCDWDKSKTKQSLDHFKGL